MLYVTWRCSNSETVKVSCQEEKLFNVPVTPITLLLRDAADVISML
jgi:hypothetical protein